MIILASQSPRRKELLSTLKIKFSIEPSHIDENKYLNLPYLDAVKAIALEKGKDIFSKHPNDTIISADTIVVIDNLIIGKPKDYEDAKRILKLLSGRKHLVITAYVIIKDGIILKKEVISEVEFKKLSDSLIEKYIKEKAPFDKAGAYGLQDNQDYNLVKQVIGSKSNVIGFPIEDVEKDLRSLSII